MESRIWALEMVVVRGPGKYKFMINVGLDGLKHFVPYINSRLHRFDGYIARSFGEFEITSRNGVDGLADLHYMISNHKHVMGFRVIKVEEERDDAGAAGKVD